jgi:hypothetical protein
MFVVHIACTCAMKGSVEWYTLSITVGTWPLQPLWSGQWGRFFHNCTINGLLFECMDELPRDEAFVFVHVPLRGANRRFLSSARSVHDPHMNRGREVYLWHFTLCCHVAALWLWKTERWRREVLWTTQLESIRAKFEVRTAVSWRIQVFSDVTPCHCVTGSRRFEGMWCFCH